jgi:outer membrane immunogenic protein
VRISKFIASIVTVSAILGIGAASAADLPERTYTKAPATSVYDWTGFYLGGSVGGVRQQASTSYSSDPSFASSGGLFAPALTTGTLASSSSQNGAGVIGGVTAGYNWQLSSLVYGIEGDWSWTGVRPTSSISPVPAFAFPTLTTITETRTDWLATVRGRIGFLAMPRTLLFATGGLAVGEIKGSTSIIPSPSCATNFFCSNGNTSSTRVGWTVGAGVEQAFASNWTVKVEYLHYDLGHVSYIAGEASTFPTFLAFVGTPNLIVNTRVSGDIGRVGVNYKF